METNSTFGLIIGVIFILIIAWSLVSSDRSVKKSTANSEEYLKGVKKEVQRNHAVTQRNLELAEQTLEVRKEILQTQKETNALLREPVSKIEQR